MASNASDYLRVSYIQTTPWLNVTPVGFGLEQPILSGPFGLVFNNIVQLLKIKVVFQQPPDGPIHGVLNKTTGNWNGVVGMLQRQEVDIVVSPITITEERWVSIKYSNPLATLYLGILGGYKEPKGNNGLSGFFLTFDLEVWSVIFLTLVVLTLLYSVGDRLHGSSKGSWYHLISSNALTFFGMLFLEASQRQPSYNSARFTLCFWWLAIMVLMTGFQGHFKAMMMLKPFASQINSLDDLMKATNVKPFIWKGVAYEQFFRTSRAQVIRDIMKRVVENDGVLNQDKLFSKDTILLVEHGEAVILNEIFITKGLASESCNSSAGRLYFARETFYPHHFAFGIRKGLPENLTKRISNWVRMADETGLISKWLNDQTPQKWSKCASGSSQPVSDDESSLGMSDFRHFFLFLLGLLFVCSVTCVLEVLVYSHYQRQRANLLRKKIVLVKYGAQLGTLHNRPNFSKI